MNFNAAACLLSQFEAKDRLLVAKTLPRHLMILPTNVVETSSSTGHQKSPLKTCRQLPAISSNMEVPKGMSILGQEESMKAPVQKAPRPTTLPTRGTAANRARRNVQIDWQTQTPGHGSGPPPLISPSEVLMMLEGNQPIMDVDASPCESPSYVTHDNTYKYSVGVEDAHVGEAAPHKSNVGGDLNPLPVPPKEGKKHIPANAKRHVRKYPLIIPVSGIQRIPTHPNMDKRDDRRTTIGIVAPTIQGAMKPTLSSASSEANRPVEVGNSDYQNTGIHANASPPSPGCANDYQNLMPVNCDDHMTHNAGDSASLQFESIVEAAMHKDQILHTPDVTNGFYNFSIHKEHYHKSKEVVVYDPQQLTGLYVNEDELRNLDIDKNLEKLRLPTEHVLMESRRTQELPCLRSRRAEECAASEENISLDPTANNAQISNSVSCEDLLDFADKKPRGCERGIDSDEVRIMLKVLGQEVSVRCSN